MCARTYVAPSDYTDYIRYKDLSLELALKRQQSLQTIDIRQFQIHPPAGGQRIRNSESFIASGETNLVYLHTSNVSSSLTDVREVLSSLASLVSRFDTVPWLTRLLPEEEEEEKKEEKVTDIPQERCKNYATGR